MTGTSAALLSVSLSNLNAMRWFKFTISRSQRFTISCRILKRVVIVGLGYDRGMVPIRWLASTWINTELLSIEPVGTHHWSWFRDCLFACSASSHNLNHCWVIFDHVKQLNMKLVTIISIETYLKCRLKNMDCFVCPKKAEWRIYAFQVSGFRFLFSTNT